ncbi:hypothetical protein AAZX31_12G040100 [Glycine max]|uniref:Uncharacterized protein n=1 Tax=Glycine max TaxID=3847 RepID=I1LQ21_SOYBN|nr:uncharacterized protein LOC100783166 [Glycine max]KAG4979516.1 hypothetical protein JHK85_033474 [Glycine max]KAG4985167.1 hypothetical protein JHK86_032858 [Glycine max]KAH1141516.1 hypothetical protein GYH30_032657 [Glycine max]KRH24451.1 hypothetical protein GLYMA_12G042000v4 [Glycine max]|eukprot:XP_003540676.1 uncharacterized protein LOC100783166 [Glycine max]
MAAIEKKTQSSLHLRSNSLPSAAHPLVSQLEEQLQRLRGSEATSSLSSSSVCLKLNDMLDLHDYTDKLLQLPMEQQVSAQECNDRCVDDLLEGSLRLLDICSTTKDCLLQSKESMCDLMSVIRRKKSNETGFAVEGVKYLAARKNMKKQIRKALENLKQKDNNTSPMLNFLNEAEAITLCSLEQLLLFISGPKRHSKHSRWSAISMLMQPKRVICDSQEANTNEFEKVDAALQSLISHRPSSIENFHSHMENLEFCIQDLEIGVDQLSRKLIRNRVSLLNIFNH